MNRLQSMRNLCGMHSGNIWKLSLEVHLQKLRWQSFTSPCLPAAEPQLMIRGWAEDGGGNSSVYNILHVQVLWLYNEFTCICYRFCMILYTLRLSIVHASRPLRGEKSWTWTLVISQDCPKLKDRVSRRQWSRDTVVTRFHNRKLPFINQTSFNLPML